MSCCNIYNIGCFDSCGNLIFIDATDTGNAVGVFTSGNITITQNVEAVNGEPIVFDLSELNENATWELNLYINCNIVTITINDIDYCGFKLKTKNIGLGCQNQTVIIPDYTPPNNEEVNELTIIGDDTSDYTDVLLIGKTVLAVFTDSAVRVPADYSFVSGTGTITFISAIDLDTVIQILYK